MSRYIKLEDLQKFPIRKDHYDKKNGSEIYVFGVEDVLEYAEYLPTADVVEVRHGVWGFDGIGWTCSECDEYNLSDAKTDYCPNCGAKMDGERREG